MKENLFEADKDFDLDRCLTSRARPTMQWLTLKLVNVFYWPNQNLQVNQSENLYQNIKILPFQVELFCRKNVQMSQCAKLVQCSKELLQNDWRNRC